MRRSGWTMRTWMFGLALLLLTAACTASRPPTPTPPPASDGGDAKAAQRPTPTPKPSPTATQKPSPTPDFTATAQAEQVAATATAQAEQEQTLAQIRHFQQAFEQLAEKYPGGYSGENLKVSYQFKDGEAALGLALWPTFSNLIQTFDSKGYILSSTMIKEFLKQNPNTRFIVAFRGTNTIIYPRNEPMSAYFHSSPGSVAVALFYNERFSMIQVGRMIPLDIEGQELLKTRASAPWALLGGTLPTKQQVAYRRWTDWQIEGYLLLPDGTLSPIGGFVGHTKWSKKSEKSGYGYLEGWVKVLTPEKVELLPDAYVLSLLNGEQK